MDKNNLPAVIIKSEEVISGLIDLVGVPRDMLPSQDKIITVIQQIPDLLSDVRSDLRDERLAKMCIAIGVGLFDSAINYVWNQTVVELRKRVIAFGLNVVKQLKGKDYTESAIDSLQDSQLLDLAHELNLIDDEGFYFLSQCRDMRNNFSAAHPSIGEIDNYELIAYINRCVKYSLGKTKSTIGVDIKTLIGTIDTDSYNEEQLKFWATKISKTSSAQKEAVFVMLFGIYCDATKKTTSRTNALTLSSYCKSDISDKIIGSIITNYEEYVGKGEEEKRKAAEDYFVRIGLMDSLKDSTRNAIISKACKLMMNIHQGVNNFYNEPLYAEYLCSLSKQSTIPEIVKHEFVETVVSCAVGNEYGYSWGAEQYYDAMIKDFSPKEIEIMLKIPDEDTYTAYKVTKYPVCIQRYKNKLKLLAKEIIPPSLLSLYLQRSI